MAQMTGKAGLKVYASIKEHIGIEAADKFASELPLSKSADYVRKFKWAKDVCNYLEENFSGEQILSLRMSCRCEPSAAVVEKLRKLYAESKDLKEFCERFAAQGEEAFAVAYADGAMRMIYPRCYCSCVKRVDETLPETWCLCTLGYAKAMFGAVFGCECKVRLIESVKTGSSRCVIEVGI